MIFLNYLPKSYDAIREIIESSREDLTLRVIVSTLGSKELDMKSLNKTMFDNGDALSVHG